MNVELPKRLHRGDSDPKRIRRIKETLPHILLTNLSSDGFGIDIFKENLVALVSKHISPGWSKTHLLSFSEDKEMAKKYAAGQENNQLDSVSRQVNWDAIVVTINTQLLDCKHVGNGIFLASYVAVNWSANNSCGKRSQILLINAADFLLDNSKGHKKEMLIEVEADIAKKSKEWLVLPIDLMIDDVNHRQEFTSVIDAGLLSNVEYYRSVINDARNVRADS